MRHSSQEVGAPRQESPISTHARTARCTTALSQHSPPSPPQPTPSPPSPCRRRHCCRCPRPCRLRTRPRHRRTCSPRPSAHDGRMRDTRTRSRTRARTCTPPAFSACASDAPRLACVRHRVAFKRPLAQDEVGCAAGARAFLVVRLVCKTPREDLLNQVSRLRSVHPEQTRMT